MNLLNQLRDEELNDVLLQGEESDVRGLFAGASDCLESVTERPQWFWQRQLAAVSTRVAACQRTWAGIAVAWAGAGALMVLALALLKSGTPPQAVRAQADSDQELLISVEQVMQSEVPQALEPATLLASEITARSTSAPSAHRMEKENDHEE